MNIFEHLNRKYRYFKIIEFSNIIRWQLSLYDDRMGSRGMLPKLSESWDLIVVSVEDWTCWSCRQLGYWNLQFWINVEMSVIFVCTWPPEVAKILHDNNMTIMISMLICHVCVTINIIIWLVVFYQFMAILCRQCWLTSVNHAHPVTITGTIK